MKIKLFTHNDLDGVACEVLVKNSFNNVDAIRCDYKIIDKEIEKFIDTEEYKKYDTLYITDISPSRHICDKLDYLYEKGKIKIELVDHHLSKKWLKRYIWATFSIKKCATLITLKMLNAKEANKDSKLSQFANAVNAYDLWILDTFYRERGENLNLLFWTIGAKEFSKAFSGDIDADLNDTAIKYVISCCRYIKDQYIKGILDSQLKNTRFRRDQWGYTFKILFASKYSPDIGHTVLHSPEGEDVDYVAVVNTEVNKCSLYARDRDDVDVSKIATHFGGGGHQKAAGFYTNLMPKLKGAIQDLLLNKE